MGPLAAAAVEASQSGARPCLVCAEDKLSHDYPAQLPSPFCSHSTNTCNECIEATIAACTDDGMESGISCPECPEKFCLDAAQRHMDEQTFVRFEEAMVKNILAKATNLMIACCPFCNQGQTHALGTKQPIVVCHACDRLFCFDHRVAWHHDHTCEEYDKSRDDPNFRSQSQIKQDKIDALEEASVQFQRQIDIAQEEWELSLLKKGEEGAKLHEIEMRRRERARRDERERQEKLKIKEEADRKAARDAEERLGEDFVHKTFASCPECHEWREKVAGCPYIHCPCGNDYVYTGVTYLPKKAGSWW